MILVMQQWMNQPPETFDFNDLRSRLGLPTLGPIDPRENDVAGLPLVRLARVQIESMGDEDLSLAFHRAVIFHAWDAARKFAQAVVNRPAFASRPERIEAYRTLVESAGSLDEGLRTINEARGYSLAAKQSCAMWDLMELSFRFGQGEANEAMRLMQHIETRHVKEPGVAQALTRMLINAGLLNPDGTPVAAGYPQSGSAGMRGGEEAIPAAEALEVVDARQRNVEHRRQALDAGRITIIASSQLLHQQPAGLALRRDVQVDEPPAGRR